MGYRGVGQWHDYYQDGEVALVMEKRRYTCRASLPRLP